MLEHGLAPTTGAYEIEQSLRFNDVDSPYLTWKPATAGNRKTWTFSTWIKPAELANTNGGQDALFSAYTDNDNRIQLYLEDTTSNRLNVYAVEGATAVLSLRTEMAFRDFSAWYHIMLVVDTTQATSSDRAKFYVNGTQVTDLISPTYPAQNTDIRVNAVAEHDIGTTRWNSAVGNYYYNGYMAETYFIDGQALTPSSFGETGAYGEWKPIEYTGTYGSNGFYLKMQKDETVEGFNTITYTGDGASNHSISGVGFTPDLVWIKSRSAAIDHQVFDSVRGADLALQSNATYAESDYDTFNSFDSDGFSLNIGAIGTNQSGTTYAAWCWDAGTGSASSNTDGTITSTVKANTAYGFSIVSYTGNATTGATVGHGLSEKPDLVIWKNRIDADIWTVYSSPVGATKDLRLNETTAANTTAVFNSTEPTSSVFTVGNGNRVNGSGDSIIAYCFHSVAGYSKIGSYTGTGAAGNAVTTGFAPAFVMIKRTDAADSWLMYDNTRDAKTTMDKYLKAETSAAEGTFSAVEFTDTGFTLQTTDQAFNLSGGSYIYIAFADTREYAFWRDYSGNNNNWTPNNLTEYDEVKDSPTNNWCTLSPLDIASGLTLNQGNLSVGGTNASRPRAKGTMSIPSSGNWYWEVVPLGNATTNMCFGVTGDDTTLGGFPDKAGDSGIRRVDVAFSIGDIIGLKLNRTTGKLQYRINAGTWADVTQVPTVSTTLDLLPLFQIDGSDNRDAQFNFGQDSSFAGHKPAQGNTDDNGYGDFYYAPPTGYLALCTANLPDATVIPSEHFNTVLWTGNGTSQSITGVGFQPDWSILKKRNSAGQHMVFDVLRGVYEEINTNTTEGDTTRTNTLTSFDSDGFSVGDHGDVNSSSDTFVGWNWKANGAGVSNTDGSITSTVSVNTSAGFSIVSYTGTATDNQTFGHGLSQAPEMVIVKNRTEGGSVQAGWQIYHKDTANNYYLQFTTAAKAAGAEAWNSTTPTSSVVHIGNSTHTNQVDDYIAYCFHSVDGFSKVGSYTGNGSTSDGTFVYTGFRPAFVLIKCSSNADDWHGPYDSERGENPSNPLVYANLSSAENAGTNHIDQLSNGFKLRSDNINQSGRTFIYIAFAENPFKHTNAR